MRMKKYRQNQTHGGSNLSSTAGANSGSALITNRTKTQSSHRGMSDLIRTQQNFQRVPTNVTIEQNGGGEIIMQQSPANQKLQNNFFFQPSSNRESLENQRNNEVSSPRMDGTSARAAYNNGRNVRTSAGGTRPARNNMTTKGQLQIKTQNN